MDRKQRQKLEDRTPGLFSAHRFEWKGGFDNASVNALHADAFGHEPYDDDCEGRVRKHSLGWVCAREGDGLVEVVNVLWDGAGARTAGCGWLHVDFESHLRGFYFDACGSEPTHSGLIAF